MKITKDKCIYANFAIVGFRRKWNWFQFDFPKIGMQVIAYTIGNLNRMLMSLKMMIFHVLARSKFEINKVQVNAYHQWHMCVIKPIPKPFIICKGTKFEPK